MWSDDDKLRAVEREIKYRRRVYGRLVEEGRMIRAKADEGIAIMEAIAEDYREKVAKGDLFGGG
jgi:hypothetical protein